MNEETKNIETCLPESILAEVASVPTDAQFRSLTDEALDPLKQQAFQQAGSDAYNEVVAQHQPYTFASQVKQMKSNLILLLRRLWRYPFGTATLRSLSDADIPRSLSDMWSHYITRLQGNAESGIPSRLDQLTDLPSAPLLVADRKISGADVPDGMSFVQLICSNTGAASFTELTDNTSGWSMTKAMPSFPNVTKATIGCKELHANVTGLSNAEELTFPNLDHIDTAEDPSNSKPTIASGSKIKKVNMPVLKRFNCVNGGGGTGVFYNITGNCEILAENCTYWNSRRGGGYPVGLHTVPGLRKMVVGTMTYFCPLTSTSGATNLIHLEIGQDTACDLYLEYWNPTNALDASRTDLIEEGSTAQNNLQQFLQNFRDHIADKLKGGYPIGQGPTLTLSQAVFSEIWDSQGQPQVKGDGLDDLRADIHRIIRTDKQWAVNKA